MVVVIDGVTAKGKRLWDGKSSGCFAKDIIIDFLQKNSIEKLDAESFLKELEGIISTSVQSIISAESFSSGKAV